VIAPTIKLSPDAVAGFDAAAVRLLRRQRPGVRWRSLRDEPNPPRERRPPARDDNGVQRAA
jgi:hypothetical protein